MALFELDANVTRYLFTAEALPEDTFQVVRFTGMEELSQLSRFELTLVSDDPNINFADVVNKPASFMLMRGYERVPIHGLVSHLEQAGKSKDDYIYRAVLVPRLWRLTLTYQSRIFQQKNLPDILTEVLQENGLTSSDFTLDLKAAYKPIEYCVQYRETDLNFIMRLMEHEGLCYYFKQEDVDVLVITDDRSGHELIEDDVMPFRDGAGMHTGGAEFIDELVYREQIVTGEVLSKDYNYRTPDTTVEGTAQANSAMPGQHYEFGDQAADADESKRLAELRAEEFECRRRVLRGTSNNVAFRAGFQFTLSEHFREDLNSQHLLTRVVHQGSQQEAMRGGSGSNSEGTVEYSNTFTCIPAAVQYRPPRVTPKPQIPGLASAKLESAGGEYAYVDEEGRYHVRFVFDRGDAAQGSASLPVRLAQPSAGAGYGTHLTSLAGTEVALAFENGDINRPVIIGALYNGSKTSPVVAENKMQNIIRTAGSNQLILDDTKDKAQITLNTPDNHRLFFDDDKDAIIIESTKKHKVTLDDKNAKIEVKTTSGHFVLMQDGKKGEGRIDVQSETGHRITIDDKEKLITITDKDKKNLFQIDIGNKKLTIKSEEGDIEMLAEKGTIDIKAKTLNMESSADTSMKAANLKMEAQQDHKMAATNIAAEAKMDLKQKGMNVSSEASMEHKSKGMNVGVEGAVKVEVKSGGMADLKAAGITTIQGAIVKIN